MQDRAPQFSSLLDWPPQSPAPLASLLKTHLKPPAPPAPSTYAQDFKSCLSTEVSPKLPFEIQSFAKSSMDLPDVSAPPDKARSSLGSFFPPSPFLQLLTPPFPCRELVTAALGSPQQHLRIFHGLQEHVTAFVIVPKKPLELIPCFWWRFCFITFFYSQGT